MHHATRCWCTASLCRIRSRRTRVFITQALRPQPLPPPPCLGPKLRTIETSAHSDSDDARTHASLNPRPRLAVAGCRYVRVRRRLRGGTAGGCAGTGVAAAAICRTGGGSIFRLTGRRNGIRSSSSRCRASRARQWPPGGGGSMWNEAPAAAVQDGQRRSSGGGRGETPKKWLLQPAARRLPADRRRQVHCTPVKLYTAVHYVDDE